MGDHRGADVELVRDAISEHVTPGATVRSDGREGFYVQSGAVCDLGGLRLDHLAASFVDDVVADHPRTGLVDDLVARINAEADAVPDGRFAVLRRTGFTYAIQFAPFPK